MEQQINSQDGDNKATTNMVQTKVIIHIPYDPSLEQMRALTENETWDLVDAPKGVKSIRCRWV